MGRARKAAAIALVKDPDTRKLMGPLPRALSTVWGPGELLNQLRERGVTEFHGTDYGDPGKPLSTLLRECADAIDRAETEQQARTLREQPPDASSANAPGATRRGRTRRKARIPTSAELQRQPGFKLPIVGGKTQADTVDQAVAPPDVPAVQTRRKA